MKNPRLDPEVAAHAESERNGSKSDQPYATELDNRELEHAQREKRPVEPNGKANATGRTPPRRT